MARVPVETDWMAVIARTLGFLCIHQAEFQGETLVKQAEFLERFGIPRSEAASILGTSERSLNEMKRQQEARAKSDQKKPATRKPTTRNRRGGE